MFANAYLLLVYELADKNSMKVLNFINDIFNRWFFTQLHYCITRICEYESIKSCAYHWMHLLCTGYWFDIWACLHPWFCKTSGIIRGCWEGLRLRLSSLHISSLLTLFAHLEHHSWWLCTMFLVSLCIMF